GLRDLRGGPVGGLRGARDRGGRGHDGVALGDRDTRGTARGALVVDADGGLLLRSALSLRGRPRGLEGLPALPDSLLLVGGPADRLALADVRLRVLRGRAGRGRGRAGGARRARGGRGLRQRPGGLGAERGVLARGAARRLR